MPELSAPRSATSRSDWWSLAACVGHDPAWWSDDLACRGEAVRICATCPVREQCLSDALDHHDVGVIRGGMLLSSSSRGYRVTSLLCSTCAENPVQNPAARSRGYCSRRCRLARQGSKVDITPAAA